MIDISGEKLIERYLYAVFTHLPRKTRVEIDRELRALISEMVTERFGERMVGEDDIKDILKELGTPSELSEKYYPEAKRSLIGSRYYCIYIQCCKIGVLTAIIGVIIAHSVRLACGNIKFDFWLEVFDVLQALFFSSFSVLTVFTVVFAFLDRFNINIKHRDEIERLPPLLNKSERISTNKCVFHICFITILTLLLCFSPQLIGILVMKNSTMKVVSLFNVEYISKFRFVLLIIMLTIIFRETIKYVEHAYTFKVAMITLMVDLICWILVSVVFSNPSVWNPAFAQALFAGNLNDNIHIVFSKMNLNYELVSVIFIMLVYIVDIINSFIKAISYSHRK